MESKKINQLATEMSPEGSDLTIIGDPITGVSRKITLIQLAGTIGAGADLQQVTDNGATTTNPIAIGGLTITGLATGVLKSDSGVVTSVPFGAANGVATLGGDGKVPSIQLPSYVDDVVEVANFAALPVTGETGKIYITLDNNKVYRWTGSIYVEIAANNAVWGAITGTLSNQTDLQTALNLKANDNAVVHLAGTETISGVKTFTTSNLFTGANLFTNFSQRFNQGVAILETANFGATVDYTTIVGAVNGLALRLSSDGKKIFAFADATTNNTFTFPNATGTIALTSNLSSYVPYTGATANVNLGTFDLTADVITGATGSFASSGGSDTFAINHSSGSGIALNITKGGNGEGLYINKTSGTGNAATIIGTLNATTLVKSGGTSSQFLKADGSVDSTSYGTGSVTSVGLSSATSGVTIGSTPITTSGTITLAIATASGSQNGLLSSTDWSTFNGKQAALNGTGFVKISGTTISYDNSTYLTTSAAASTYLALSGGTLTGVLNGTSATFSGNMAIGSSTTALSPLQVVATGTIVRLGEQSGTTGKQFLIGIDGTSGRTELQSVWQGTGFTSLALQPSGGNVLIGTTGDNGSRLQVGGSVLGHSLTIQNTNSGYYSTSDYLDNAGTEKLIVGYANSGAGALASKAIIYGTSGVGLNFYTNGSTTAKMVIDTTGAATFSSSVDATIFNSTSNAFRFSGSNALSLVTLSGQNVVKINAAGYWGTQLVGANDQGILINNVGNVGIGTSSPASSYGFSRTLVISNPDNAEISLEATTSGKVLSIGVVSGFNYFQTTSGNGYDFQSGGSSKMVITSGGNVLIGKTTTSIATNGTRFDANGESFTSISSGVNTLHVYDTSNSVFRFYVGANGTINATNTTISAISDVRLKENIEDLEIGLDAIMALRPRKFDWKKESGNSGKNIRGFIAQEFEEIFPDLIDESINPAPEGEEPYKQIRQDLIPILVKAMQQQQAQIQELEARIKQLENK